MENFLKRCAEEKCVIIPIKVYSKWTNNDLDDKDFIGMKYGALEAELFLIQDENFPSVFIDEVCNDFFDSPEEALTNFINNKG